MPSRVARLLELVEWDGVLPMVMALGPLVIRTFFPKPPFVAGLLLVLGPPVAALIRAHIGWGQIAKRCGGRAPVLRQVAMAVAIVLLFAFEVSVTILTFEKNAPASAWWIPALAYAGYLVVVSFALRRSADEADPVCEPGVSMDGVE